jgi:hypothetical protein
MVPYEVNPALTVTKLTQLTKFSPDANFVNCVNFVSE